ncbi:hypothetical protein SCANM63S_07489 [Streptomyces canarius]
MRAAITLWRNAGAGDTVMIPSMISTLLPSGHSISSQYRTRSSQFWSESWLTVSALMAVSYRCVTDPQHAERDRCGSTGPVRGRVVT